MNTLDGALPEPGTWKLDPPHTFVGFKARHKVVGAVRGRFERTNGTVVVAKDPADSGVEVSIDSSSLSSQNAVRGGDVKGSRRRGRGSIAPSSRASSART